MANAELVYKEVMTSRGETPVTPAEFTLSEAEREPGSSFGH